MTYFGREAFNASVEIRTAHIPNYPRALVRQLAPATRLKSAAAPTHSLFMDGPVFRILKEITQLQSLFYSPNRFRFKQVPGINGTRGQFATPKSTTTSTARFLLSLKSSCPSTAATSVSIDSFSICSLLK